ncbi:MAG: hypothetical protein OXG81_13580 [Acidobacteria bacterium]|nr:hypothetical protein [Acidobacteriota bacterium]MCY4122965.1 hypothetical protein [Acidobacteriota bacterium]
MDAIDFGAFDGESGEPHHAQGLDIADGVGRLDPVDKPPPNVERVLVSGAVLRERRQRAERQREARREDQCSPYGSLH